MTLRAVASDALERVGVPTQALPVQESIAEVTEEANDYTFAVVPKTRRCRPTDSESVIIGILLAGNARLATDIHQCDCCALSTRGRP